MGATNPANAEEGTIRKKYAGSIEENAIHGSDGEDTAKFEIGYFFAGYELVNPMRKLDIDLAKILEAMYEHYLEVTDGLPAFPEKGAIDVILSLLRKSTPVTIPEAYPVPVPITALAFTPKGDELLSSGYHEVVDWKLADDSVDTPKRVLLESGRPDSFCVLNNGESCIV